MFLLSFGMCGANCLYLSCEALSELLTCGTRETQNKKVLFGIGGGHYAPRHMDIIM